MLKRLRKLKSGVRYYAANYKNNQDSNITDKELQLVTQIILLLEPFFCIKGVYRVATRSEKVRKSVEKLRKMTKVR